MRIVLHSPGLRKMASKLDDGVETLRDVGPELRADPSGVEMPPFVAYRVNEWVSEAVDTLRDVERTLDEEARDLRRRAKKAEAIDGPDWPSLPWLTPKWVFDWGIVGGAGRLLDAFLDGAYQQQLWLNRQIAAQQHAVDDAIRLFDQGRYGTLASRYTDVGVQQSALDDLRGQSSTLQRQQFGAIGVQGLFAGYAAYNQYNNSAAQTTWGRRVSTGAAFGTQMTGAGGLVDLISLGSLGPALDTWVVVGEAAATGSTAGLDQLNENNLSGQNGPVMQGWAMIGDEISRHTVDWGMFKSTESGVRMTPPWEWRPSFHF